MLVRASKGQPGVGLNRSVSVSAGARQKKCGRFAVEDVFRKKKVDGSYFFAFCVAQSSTEFNKILKRNLPVEKSLLKIHK